MAFGCRADVVAFELGSCLFQQIEQQGTKEGEPIIRDEFLDEEKRPCVRLWVETF
jgi:hypothetical protein